MPIYEYQCQYNHITEQLDSLDSPDTIQCHCGKVGNRIVSLAHHRWNDGMWRGNATKMFEQMRRQSRNK